MECAITITTNNERERERVSERATTIKRSLNLKQATSKAEDAPGVDGVDSKAGRQLKLWAGLAIYNYETRL